MTSCDHMISCVFVCDHMISRRSSSWAEHERNEPLRTRILQDFFNEIYKKIDAASGVRREYYCFQVSGPVQIQFAT